MVTPDIQVRVYNTRRVSYVYMRKYNLYNTRLRLVPSVPYNRRRKKSSATIAALREPWNYQSWISLVIVLLHTHIVHTSFDDLIPKQTLYISPYAQRAAPSVAKLIVPTAYTTYCFLYGKKSRTDCLVPVLFFFFAHYI